MTRTDRDNFYALTGAIIREWVTLEQLLSLWLIDLPTGKLAHSMLRLGRKATLKQILADASPAGGQDFLRAHSAPVMDIASVGAMTLSGRATRASSALQTGTACSRLRAAILNSRRKWVGSVSRSRSATSPASSTK